MTEWRIAVGDESTRAVYEPTTSGADRAACVCAHGAGGSMSDRSTLAAANKLRSHGFGVVRFNFLYKEKGSGRPDPMPKLRGEQAVHDVEPAFLARRPVARRDV